MEPSTMGMGLRSEPNYDPDISDQEVEAFWELVRQRPRHLGRRFVAEALRENQTTRQLRNRARLAMQAAVGLNESDRAAAEDLLRKAMRDQELSGEKQRNVALTLLRIDSLDSNLSSEATRFVLEDFCQTLDRKALLQKMETCQPLQITWRRGRLAHCFFRFSKKQGTQKCYPVSRTFLRRLLFAGATGNYGPVHADPRQNNG